MSDQQPATPDDGGGAALSENFKRLSMDAKFASILETLKHLGTKIDNAIATLRELHSGLQGAAREVDLQEVKKAVEQIEAQLKAADPPPV